MHRPLTKQFVISLGLLLGTILFLTGILAVLGEVKIDTPSGSGLGLFSSALLGSPSYYNPLFCLLEMTEFPALVILPLVMILFRQQLRVQVLPWILVLLSLPLSIVVMRTFTEPVANPNVSSLAAQWEVLQLVPAFALSAGYLILAMHNRSQTAKHRFIHKKRKVLT